MKKLLTYLLICLFIPCYVLADDIKSFNFPKDKGVLMYGATLKDEKGPLNYVSFFSNEGKITKLGRIDEEDNGTHMRNLRCGAFCGDKYYGFLVNMYSFVEEPKAFGTVDFNTGVFTTIRGNYNKDERLSWPTLYEMTYDNTNDICYALGRNRDGLFVSDLYKINLTDGSYEMLTSLNFYAWAMACDYEGNIYMIKGIPDKKNEFYAASSIVRIDTKDNYAEKNEVRIKVKDKDFIPNYTHTMEFDHDSNHLHWLGMSNDGWQKAFVLDINTGIAEETADMMYNIVSGLYIPFNGADNRNAAGMVKNLVGEPAADGSLRASLTWTNPTTNWKGDALNTLKYVTVARNSKDDVIATLDTDGIGSNMTFEDMEAHKGYNVYYVTAWRMEGERGQTDSVRVFVGADTPGRPQNVKTSGEGNDVRITWEAPATGAHGENFDLTSTVYEITRMPDNIIIASNIAGYSFLDDNIGSRKQYTYVVKAFNNEGEGLSEESSPIVAGNAYELPFHDNFDTDLCVNMWTSVDANYDGIKFEWAGGGAEDFFRYQIWLNNMHDTNDFMITPPLVTKPGTAYRVNYEIQVGNMDDLHKFVVVTGDAPTLEGMTNRIDSVDNLKCESYNQIYEYENKFTADKEETYIGINCMSQISNTHSYFAVRNFSIEEIFAKDLAVTDFNGIKDLTVNVASDINVNVKNMGSEAVGGYKVEIISKDADGNIMVIGNTEVNESLQPDMNTSVTVKAVAKTDGMFDIAARVILDGDMNESNNMSEWNSCKVNPAGTTDWNVLVEGEKTGISTTEPMNFYNLYSTVETIYLKDEIKAEKDGKITRIAYQYSDNSITEETEECDIKIYMSNTDRNDYSSSVAVTDWTPMEASKLVCEKKIKIIPGTDNMMVFDLDNPFIYDHTKNLSIQVWKEGALDEMFPALFRTYDFGSDVFRGLRYNNNYQEFEFSDTQDFFPVNNVPVLHMAVDFEDHSDIIEINGSKQVSYNNGMLTMENGIITNVKVTDITGKVIYSKKVNAANLRLNLGAGLYIIKASDNNGNTHIIKIAI